MRAAAARSRGRQKKNHAAVFVSWVCCPRNASSLQIISTSSTGRRAAGLRTAGDAAMMMKRTTMRMMRMISSLSWCWTRSARGESEGSACHPAGGEEREEGGEREFERERNAHEAHLRALKQSMTWSNWSSARFSRAGGEREEDEGSGHLSLVVRSAQYRRPSFKRERGTFSWLSTGCKPSRARPQPASLVPRRQLMSSSRSRFTLCGRSGPRRVLRSARLRG